MPNLYYAGRFTKLVNGVLATVWNYFLHTEFSPVNRQLMTFFQINVSIPTLFFPKFAVNDLTFKIRGHPKQFGIY